MYDYLIVGAGLYGAVFAQEAKRAGKSVLVIDKRPHIAGNVYTEKVEGIIVHKYGAHIFHTNNRQVWEYVNHGLNTVPDYGTGNWPAEADGCIKCEIITEVSKRVVFVEICRAIGILARLNPVTGKAEGVCEKNGEICFESMV